MQVLWIPASLWIPVVSPDHYHRVGLTTVTRFKRDFGITTAITAAILAALAGGITAAVAFSEYHYRCSIESVNITATAYQT